MNFFLITLMILVAGCSQAPPILYQRDPKWVVADNIYDHEIGKPVFLRLVKEKKLHVCESGYGLRGAEKIRVMHCGFDYYNMINLEEARALLAETINLYLKTINENERIRPFLNNYPFNTENIEIRIFLFNPNGSLPAPERLQTVSIVDGKLKYRNGVLDSIGLPQTIWEETYEEALSKL